MPEDAHIRIGSLLSEDSNAFVKKAAEKSTVRRQRSTEQSQRLRRNMGQVQSRMESFRQTYGSVAMKEMRRIADEQFSSLVQQTHHDIRNIVSPVLTNITTLERQLVSGPDKKFCAQKLKDMARSLMYLERFLTQMREYAKVSIVPRRRERLAEMITEAHSMAMTTLQAEKVPIPKKETEITVPEMATVFVARHQVLLALVHLIRNAYESFNMGTVKTERPQVKVIARESPDRMVTVTVEDNGPGIHPEDLGELRKFLPGKKSWKQNGTGFGLPTTVRYIAAQGGTLTIESKVGKGTKVTIMLPIDGEEDDE